MQIDYLRPMTERIILGLLDKAKAILNRLISDLKILKNKGKLDKELSSLLSNIY